MISGLIKMIFIVFRIFIESMNHERMLDKDIRGIGFRGCGKGGNIQGVAGDLCGYVGKMKKEFLKIYHRSREKSMLKKIEKMQSF